MTFRTPDEYYDTVTLSGPQPIAHHIPNSAEAYQNIPRIIITQHSEFTTPGLGSVPDGFQHVTNNIYTPTRSSLA